MQNEETPTEVNPFLEIASSMYQKPAQPVAQPDNPFMELAPSMRALSQPPAIGSLSAVMGINPDQAAEATKLGKPLGIGQDLGLRNMDELRRRSMIASVQRSGMLQNNPRFAESLLDPVFAAQAHDDLDSLNKTSGLFDTVASFLDAPNWFFGFKPQADIVGGAERGTLIVERGEVASRQMFGSATPADVARLEFLDKRLGAIPSGGIVSMTAEVVAQQLATARSVGTTALAGAAVGGAVLGPKGAVGGFVAGGAGGLMATTTQTEAGNLYRDMVNQGIDPDTAQYAALTGGLLNGIIELAGAKVAAAPFKALASKFIKEGVNAAIAKPTTRAAMAIAGKEYAKQVGTETAEEVGQELVAIASEEIAKAMDGIDSETSFKDAMTRLVDAGIAGFQGSLVLGGIGPTANFVVDVKRADVAAKQQEFFDGLDAAKRDGKLPKRNLDAYEGFLARQAKGTTADTVYVEAEAAAQVLAQSGLSVTELEKVLPGIREQLKNALENGGDITIPTAVYGAKLSGTQLGDALRPHMRLSPEAMSVAQAQEFSRKRDALRQEAQAALAERQEADAAFVESAQKVETTVAEQLRQTGMQDIEVRANAELFRDLAVTQAARMGITPEQFYERYPYRVRGPQVVQEGQPLEQPRREPAPEKGVFDANNPPADVTAEGSRKAIMAVMDYEGKIYYDRAATMHGDLLDSFPELDADLIIDGGFIRDGKYIPNMSDGGFAAIEGGRERLEEVKAFAEQANRRSPKVFEQAGRIDAETQSINEAATAVSDDVLKAESQPEIPQAIDNVAALDEVGRLATGQTWAKGRDLKEEMQNRVLSLAANAGVNLSLDTPQTTEYLTRIGYRDALYALRQNPNSVGWYDEKTRQAIAVMALVHPELLTDENARFAFTWALAVTSNGIKVDKNFELADSVYRTYKATGKMPTNLTAGQAQAAINRSLGMFNELRDAWGIDNLRRFAQTEYTIQELRYIVDDFDAGGEFAETTVKGAGILGPKIGNGFFSNLYGDFRSLTMDRWLIRTWGRWTGTLIKAMPVQTQKARARLGQAVMALDDATRTTIASILRDQIPESQQQQREVIDAFSAGEVVDLDVLSTVIQKASMDKDARAALNESMAGQEIRKSGNSLAKYLDGQKEAPAGPGERVQIRSVFASILQELQKLPEYSDLTMADLQAALWYAEKRLYETAKEDIQVDEESIEGYADDEAPDYANAASNVARSSGVSEQRIQATLAKESNSERSRRARLEDEQGKPIDARDQGPVGGFTAKEKRSFNGAAVIRNHRASRGGNAGQPGTYQRSGSKADAKPRLVKKLGARVVAKFNVSTRLRNALKAAGGKQRPFSAPSFLELEQGDISAQAFHKLITDSKQKNAYGASVYAYPVDDYASMRLFVTEDLQSGFALKPDGDIVSVFSMSDSGAGHAIVQMAVSQGGRKLDAFETVLPYLYAPHGFRVVSRLRWDESQKPDGWDKQIFKEFNNGEPDVVFMVYDPTYYGQHSKNDGKVATSYDAAVRAQTREVKKIAQAGQFQQAMPGRAPRGDFDPAKLMTTLREGRDFSTFAHETAHFYLTILADIARSATGPQQTKADMDALLTWFGIEGATPAERLAKWSSLTIDQQRQYHEQFAYSFEIYLHEGKAPSVEMQSLFNQFAAWLKRVYKSIRDELNATYKAQFGRDLPMMSSEIRLVMDRMLATDEQIARAQAVRGMKAMFQTQEQSGMNDAEWAAYQALEQDATDAATAELTKATLKELQWYGNAQSKYLRDIQAKHDRARKEIREEVSAQVQLEPVYRAMEFLKRGTIRTDTGEVTAATGAFKLDLAKVRAIMPAGFDPASLKYGKYGMVQEGGIDPDMAAGMFGYGSGVELINAILGAKPIKEEIDARTDQRMLDENSDLATPEARQAAVDMAIHNEARARFIAVEQRWLEKQRRPANDMLQAARQVAQDIIGDVVIRTLNPRRYEAAEAEAARTATTAYREPQDPSTAGQAAATRAYNKAIADGMTPDEATVAATEAGVAAVAKAREQRADFDAKYGGREPAEVARRAKRQQLVQNQLAREAMLAKEEIAAAGRDFRKFFRSDEKLAKTRDMAPIMAARAILSYYGYGKRGESPAQYLDQLRTYAPDLYDGIAPIVLKSLSGTADYRDLTVTEFRVLRDTVQALWAQARRDRQITVEGERVALDVVLKEMADRLQAIGVGELVGQRQAPGAVDQANRHLLGLRAMMSRVEAWADALDGMAGPGAFTKYLFRPVKQAVDAYRIERNKYVERFVKLLDGIDLPVGKIAAPELDYTFGNGNGGIGRAELLGALMHTGNEGNYRKLLLGRGWGELDADGNLDDSRWRSFIARMIAEGKLTKADYDFVQSIWDLLEEIKPLAQRAHFDMYGYYFKEVEATEVVTPFGTYRGGYVPAATDKFMVQDARVNASMDELEGDWRNSLPSTGAGFTKGRVDYNEALSLDLRLIATHTDAVLRFSMIQPSVKDALKILRDRDLKALLERFDPAVMENMLLPWLNRAARQQATEPGRWKLADKFWGGVRSRAGVATMFANLRNALQQVTGWFPSLLKVKRRYLQSALMTYLGSPKQTAEAVARLSPFMADRMRNQMFELQGTMNELLLNPSKYEKLQQWSSKHGYFLQQAFQNMVDVTTWQGAYNQALAEGETQAEAVARGDAAVRLTQGSLSPEDLSMFEVGTPFYRTFVQFTGYFNMLANLNLGEFQKTVRDMGWRSGKGRLLYIYVMGMLLPAIVSDAIVRSLGGGWDDEDEDGYMDVFMDWFFGSQVRMGAALLPFGSTAYTAITTAFNDKPYDDRITTSPSIAALESATIGTSKAIIAVTDEDKDVTGRNVRDVLTLITLLTGVPVSALGRPAGYLVDVERGEIEPESGYDMIRGMITGTATPESKR